MQMPAADSVLLVDDDQPILETVARYLHGAGFKVVTAADGNEAQAKLAAADVGAVVTDYQMPNRDAWFERLGRVAAESTLRVLVISGAELPRDIADRFTIVRKPIDFVALHTLLSQPA